MTFSEIVSTLGIPLALSINAITLFVIYQQSTSAQRQLRLSLYQSMSNSWTAVGKLEVEDVELHRTLMGPRATLATIDVTEKDLKRRAFVHLVMDVISQKMRVEYELEGTYPAYADIAFSNLEFCRSWWDLEVREAWDGDPLQSIFDDLARKTLKSSADKTQQQID